jgi:hypothetical protein
LFALALAAGSNRASAAVIDGLLFYAPFENSSANDVSGGKAGSLGGSPAYVSTAGIIGNFVQLANDAVLPETYVYWEDPTPATDNFSVQVWIRSANLRNGQASGDPAILANKNWGSGGNPGWVVALGPATGQFQWNFRAPPAARADFDPSSASAIVQDGGWHHLVVTHDRSGFAIFYVDGAEVGRVTIAAGAGLSVLPSVPGIFALGNDNSLNYENGNGSTANGDFDEVAVWNRVLFSGEISRIYTAGRGGVGILNVPEPTTPFVSEVSPSDGARAFSPEGAFRAVIVDASTQLNPTSVKLYLDGALVTHSLSGALGTNTVSFTPPALLAPQSTHEYRLQFADNGSPAVSKTNRYSFTVGTYLNLLLPPPIALETFDGVPEATLPPGWTATNATSSIAPGPNLDDPSSDSYLDWVIISSNRLASVFDNRRLNVTLVATNGRLVKSLINGNLAYAESDNRDGNQVQVLFSPDYNLSGKTNVYLSFHSLYEQNQDSAGSVEYSIDEGATWLPVVYMIDAEDIIRDASGVIDAVATLNTARGDQAYGTSYGAYIGAAISQDLAPYISARVNDDPLESKRVEFFRLPQADQQSKVRLRFAQSGTGSWYFGIDDVGFYSVDRVAPPFVTVTPTNQVEAQGNAVLLTPSIFGIGPFTYQWQFNGVNLPGQTNESLVLTNVQPGQSGSYSLVVGYTGGVTNSNGGTLSVIEPALALVTGQWDFDSFDLSASCGADLDYSDDFVLLNTVFTSTDFFSLPHIEGQDVTLMQFPGPFGKNGYRMRHGIAANGGGARVNQYTLIMDLLFPAAANNLERALLQTNPDNTDNRDASIGPNNGVGVTGGFQGTFLPDTWQRVAIAVDLSGPGSHPIMAKFINGVKVGQQILTEGRDGRWSLRPSNDVEPWALLFADDDVDVQQGFVSSIQIRNGRLSDADIARLGGPTAKKIAGCIRTRVDGNNVIINWTGGVPLQSANELIGPWSDVPGATSPLTVPIVRGGKKFYRPKL